jgi:hypothetical protein
VKVLTAISTPTSAAVMTVTHCLSIT